MKLQNLVSGQWLEGQAQGVALHNPVSGEILAYADSTGVDLSAALAYSREQGGPALQAMSYAERAEKLSALADLLQEGRDKYYQLALQNSGNTQADAGIDVDGGIATLRFYAALGKTLGGVNYLCEPGMDRLSREKSFQSTHILTPKRGVAIHINAFNFPSWGLWEKASVALLAGVPVFAKPATTSCLLTHEMIKDVDAAGILPSGSLSLICGGGHDLMDYVQANDVVLFTGSADTAVKLKSNPQVIKSGVSFNVEADSLNMSVLAPDVAVGAPLFEAFIKEVSREMTVKAGQKCTAIRRIMVPAGLMDDVASALADRLAKVVVGDPAAEGVRMGPLVNKAQQQAAWQGIEVLSKETTVVCGASKDFEIVGGDVQSGCFVPPTLLRCDTPFAASRIHDTEVFGPVSTLMPYSDENQLEELATLGGGSLAGSIFSGDADFVLRMAPKLASSHGRLLFVDETVMAGHTGHGLVMPQCAHGGPGRAGGGEELGGLRGLRVYHQRTAIQANVESLQRVKGVAGEQFL